MQQWTALAVLKEELQRVADQADELGYPCRWLEGDRSLGLVCGEARFCVRETAAGVRMEVDGEPLASSSPEALNVTLLQAHLAAWFLRITGQPLLLPERKLGF